MNKGPSLTFPVSPTAHRLLSAAVPVAGPDPVAGRAAAALAEAVFKEAGRTSTRLVTADPQTAGFLWQRCHAFLDAVGPTSDRNIHREKVAVGRVADLITERVRAAGWTYPSRAHLPVPGDTVADEDGPRRNYAPLRPSKFWAGRDGEIVLSAGPGEPVRTGADMRAALGDLLSVYLSRFPFERPLSPDVARRVVALIVSDHYPNPGGRVGVTRGHLAAYIRVVNLNLTKKSPPAC